MSTTAAIEDLYKTLRQSFRDMDNECMKESVSTAQDHGMW